jgi:hypothetical protein
MGSPPSLTLKVTDNRNQCFMPGFLLKSEDPMSNQDFTRGAATNPRASDADRGAKSVKDAFSTASSFAEETAGKVKQAASDTAETLAGEVKGLLNRQVGSGADMLGCVARSARRAAEDLERDSPQIAGLVRTLACQVDGYANGLQDQSVDQLWRSAADYTRRQPALVFGLAAVAGFFALRTLKSAPSISAPPIQPSPSYSSGPRSPSYGP